MTLPLTGVRIVEMGQLIAIPHAIKLLADMGAEVVRIESCVRMETYRSSSFYENDPTGQYWNRCANFYEQNRNKLGLTLDLGNPSGIDAMSRLIAISDVFAENFTHRVMRNFGLEYEDVRRLRPDIIMVSSTGYGHTGPWGSLGAIAYTTEATSGLAHMTGYEGGPPIIPDLPYADYPPAEHTAFAIVAALVHRARTGKGQFIDVSQAQAVSSTIPEALMDYAANGRTLPRMGNEDAAMSPHGCYPCTGDDSWIAIAVSSDPQWRSLCETLGGPPWSNDPRFGDSLSRWEHRHELDTLVGEATMKWDREYLLHLLQRRGVPAGAVLDGKDLLFDPHLKARGFYGTFSHHVSTGMPPLPYAGTPWKLSDQPILPRRAAPILGEHNRRVLSEMIGMTVVEVEALEEGGVIGYAPVGHPTPTATPLEEQQRTGRIRRYEANFRERLEREYGA